MSDTVKVGDVIALPVGIEPREGDPNFVRLYDASNFGVCPRIAKMFAVAVKNAINNHDRLQAENDRMRAALKRARVDMEAWAAYAGDYLIKKHLAGDLAAIDAALQACNAQENANG